jgi:hypothetical protein
MSGIDGYSIATLVLFFVSTFFVIRPVSFRVHVPFYPKFSVKITLGMMTAPIIVICILWASQCIGPTQIRDGIIGVGQQYSPQLSYLDAHDHFRRCQTI